MYAPQPFRVDDPERLAAFVAEHSFGTLFTPAESGAVASHLPFLIDRVGAGLRLRAHVARANAHAELLEERDSLAVFVGPHAYVSPRWYESRDNVPTWDYIAVHARGRARIVRERERVIEILAALAARYEESEDPWTMRDLGPQRLESFLGAIVAFEIPIARLDGSFKLSQNRSPVERESVAQALRREGRAELADAVARG